MSRGDQRFEELIGRVLRIGVITSSACLTMGLALSLTPASALAGVLLNVGIVVLIATPAARVAFSVIQYALARDWTFTLLTSIVLLELVGGAIAAVVFHRRL